MTPTKTPFAGYEALGPGDPLSSDGYALQARNPFIADLMAKLGAVLHRHDAHDPMANPSAAPDVEATDTGGSIDAGTTISVQYTLSDPQGGETLPTDPVQVVIGGGYQDPTGAPTVAVDFSAGTLLASTPMYAVSVTDGLGGETALGPPVSVTVSPAASAQALLSGLSAITNTSSSNDADAGWRLWRSMDGGVTWDLMSTGPADTDTWTDDGSSVGDCSVSPLTQGTTGSTGAFSVNVPAGQPAEATFINIYGCTDGAFISPCLLGTYPITDAGTAQTYDAIAVQGGSPPGVSTCVGGANQIDPDTDILDWPWQRPVATAADLPTDGNDTGDVRVTQDTGDIYAWDGTEWVAKVSTGISSVEVSDGGNTGNATTIQLGGGPGIAVVVQDDGGGLVQATISLAQGAPADADSDYTFASGDDNWGVESTSADAVTFTVPTNANVGFPVGTKIEVCQIGAGQITIVGDTGVTIDAPGGLAHTNQQFSTIYVRQRAADEWVLSGDLA